MGQDSAGVSYHYASVLIIGLAYGQGKRMTYKEQSHGTRPVVGHIEYRPCKLEGTRIEPPMSVPIPKTLPPDPIRAPSPPELPPEIRA